MVLVAASKSTLVETSSPSRYEISTRSAAARATRWSALKPPKLNVAEPFSVFKVLSGTKVMVAPSTSAIVKDSPGAVELSPASST